MLPVGPRGTPRTVLSCYTGLVRGDSLRDLYAKALALLGLGLLGVAGALVDYWPVHGDVPYVASVLTHPAGLAALTADANASMPVIAPPVTAPLANATVAPIPVPDPVVPIGALADERPATPPAPAPHASNVASLSVAPASPASLPAYTLDLIPPATTDEPELAPESPAAPVNHAQNGENMFTGAAKSIGKASARTGTTIASGFVSAASAIGRMFRK